jgi:hypothetical protein
MGFSELERATVCVIYATQEARQKKMSNGSTLACAHARRDASRYCRVELLRGQEVAEQQEQRRNNTFEDKEKLI